MSKKTTMRALSSSFHPTPLPTHTLCFSEHLSAVVTRRSGAAKNIEPGPVESAERQTILTELASLPHFGIIRNNVALRKSKSRIAFVNLLWRGQKGAVDGCDVHEQNVKPTA